MSSILWERYLNMDSTNASTAVPEFILWQKQNNGVDIQIIPKSWFEELSD